jgi:integrase
LPPFVPYIYSREELRRLLDAAGCYQRGESVLNPVTFRTILLLLYGTGLRDGEVIRLNRADVDLDHSLLTVRLTKFHKSRLVPFGPQIGQVLTEYAHTRVRAGEETPFFTTRKGTRIVLNTLQAHFRRVRALSGIRRTDGAYYQPRLHDLRHTFAVHRLTSWYQQGADVQNLVFQLSVYLGHAHLADTQVYLSMTQDLLREANARFESYAERGRQP